MLLELIAQPSGPSMAKANQWQIGSDVMQALLQQVLGALSGGGGAPPQGPINMTAPGGGGGQVFGMPDTAQNQARVGLDKQLRAMMDTQRQEAGQRQGQREAMSSFLDVAGDPTTANVDAIIQGAQQIGGGQMSPDLLGLQQAQTSGLVPEPKPAGSPSGFFDRMMRIHSQAQRDAEKQVGGDFFHSGSNDVAEYHKSLSEALDKAYQRFGYKDQQDFQRQLIQAQKGLQGRSGDLTSETSLSDEDIEEALIRRLMEGGLDTNRTGRTGIVR